MNTSKEKDNVETKGLLPVIKGFLEDINIGFDPDYSTIEDFEFKSRDGFSAFEHNRGGMDLLVITTTASLIGSGYHMGTSIEEKVEKQWNDTFDEVQKENPNMSDDELSELVYELESDEYSGQAFRVRVMYEGNNTLRVYAGWDNDAPYYRWNNKPEFEKTIKFKTKRDLKTKLNKCLKAISKLN